MSEIDWSDGIGEEDDVWMCWNCKGPMFETTHHIEDEAGNGYTQSVAVCPECHVELILDEWSDN